MQLICEEVEKCRPICNELAPKVKEYAQRVSDKVINSCASTTPMLGIAMKEVADEVSIILFLRQARLRCLVAWTWTS